MIHSRSPFEVQGIAGNMQADREGYDLLPVVMIGLVIRMLSAPRFVVFVAYFFNHL
ncbi:MAG: hypothetical protein Q4F00_06385 [bacterium]|nr:hypothetical protein [bacterium]